MILIIGVITLSAEIRAQDIVTSERIGTSNFRSKSINYKAFNHSWRWNDRKWGTAFIPGIYKSYSNIYVDLDKEEEVIFWQEDEFGLYRDLARRSIHPGFFLIEFTGYPVASITAWMEENRNNFYRNFDIGENFNLLKSLGAGFQEPWSIALFLGHLGTFWDRNEKDELIIAATGVSGLALTGGLYQLFDNSYVESNWFRAEWKLKGSGGYGSKKRSWDLKAGYRWYGIAAVSNSATLVLKRRKTQKTKVDWRLFHNSVSSIELELPTSELEDGLSRILFAYGKYFPILGRMAGLKIGVLYENRKEYDSLLRKFSSEKTSHLEIIIMPLILI